MISRFQPVMLVQVGIVITFALIPLWLRVPQPPFLPELYVSRFVILAPMLWTVGVWLILGMPGLRDLRKSRWGRWWALCLLLLALWGFASLLWAFAADFAPEVGQTAALQWGVVALFVVVVACCAPPRTVIAVITLSLSWNAIITILQAANQGELGLDMLGEFDFNTGLVGVSLLRAGDATFIRPYGLLPHPNVLGGSLVLGVLAAGAWQFSERAALRLAGLLLAALGLVALLFTFSRAAWLGLAAGGLVLLLALLPELRVRKFQVTAGSAALVALVIGAAFFIAYRAFIAARMGAGEESIELRSVADRIVFTDFALRAINENPIGGVGIGNFPWRTSYYLTETFYELRGDNVHHVFLSAAAELGIVGLGLLIAALIAGIGGTIQAIRATTGDKRRARSALLAVVCALIVIGFFDHYPYTLITMQTAWWGCLAAALRHYSPPQK